MVLDLVDSRRDCDVGKKLLKVSLAILFIPSFVSLQNDGGKSVERDTYVRNPDRLSLPRSQQLLQRLPRVNMRMPVKNIPLPIRQRRKPIMVPLGIHRHGPMNHDQIEIIQPQALQALVHSFLHPLRRRLVRAPHFGRDEDVRALHAGREGLSESFAYGVFVGVAVGAVDGFVAVLEGVGDGCFYFVAFALPGSWFGGVPQMGAGLDA